MRAVVQRVSEASVRVEGATVGRIGAGLLVLLGVGRGDAAKDAEQLADRVLNLRIFADEAGQMNRSVIDVRGELLVVSQFTLYGDVRRGRRPSFDAAATPAAARELYETFVRELRAAGLPVSTGEFQAMMQVELANDGPVTILVDSRRTF
jgi:D-aminoacyl-tRNA deacylase